ncbi:dihydropteroate synthase [Dissulfurirhabdus thermomarina]|uniref:Dihydropteroate synthase n=1 Tax=Dissulfurirhabdus thermomarina TaxID=1765737 RepID=A0A6N9TNI0_DISTH|nr:dihydropteroate synthase [Dissulfurirhabdus thermomarina]NDY42841.1 dihydropteroate synthase [Dissulfurirhabdus thermomarina]NMX24238.1 dihydropteroate synthase [Dissulfurirhabdus thermomarina]
MRPESPPAPLVLRRSTFHWGSRTYIMGVLNVTPDSFSDGGRFLDPEAAVEQALALEAAGADIVDVGGESTRPYADPVTEEEELRRTVPVIEAIRRRSDVPVSIDTTKAAVAEAALAAGADMINDVSALRADPRMAETAARHGAPVVLMHMRGTPGTMQDDTHYDDLVGEVHDFLAERVAWAEARGIPRGKILVDPGIGFGKSYQGNLVLLNRLDALLDIGVPVLVGPSRKAFLGAVTGRAAPAERDAATLGAVAAAALRGCHVVRVHDPAPTVDVLKAVDAIRSETLPDPGAGERP